MFDLKFLFIENINLEVKVFTTLLSNPSYDAAMRYGGLDTVTFSLN